MTAIITADEIRACNPCGAYPKNQIRKLLGDGLTPAAVAALAIPYDDRMWALTNVLARRDRVALVRWAVDCAESVVHLVPGQRWAAVAECLRVTRAWCAGTATVADVSAARSAVYAAYAYAAAAAAANAAYAAANAADAAAAYASASAYDTTRATQLAALVAAFNTPTTEPQP